MFEVALPVLFAMFLWWFSTGAILYVDGLPRWTFRWSLGGLTALSGVAVFVLSETASWMSPLGAYVAFAAALVVWAWHELSFLMGLVTGPRREPCPPGAEGWERFRLATAAVIHHEVALAVTWLGVVVLTWGAPNQVGTWTFGVLWIMRLSAKLNVFLGVSNLTEEFIPDHLQYLRSYFRRAPLNPVMPFSVLGSALVAGLLIVQAGMATPGGFVQTGTLLVATMLALALLEHLFLVVPLPDALLWRWALRSHARRRAIAAAD
jgi:putative photosynthetic complex assembly protein 2